MCERRTLPMPGTERGWGGLLPPATAWGAFWCGTRGVSRQAGRQVFARSAIYSCCLVARRRNWRVRRSGYLYIRRNKSQRSLLLVLTSRWKLPLLFLPSLGILRDRSSAAGENLLLQPSLQRYTRPVRHAPAFVAGSKPSSPFSAAALRRVVHSSRALLCLSRTAPPAASQWTTSSTLIP